MHGVLEISSSGRMDVADANIYLLGNSKLIGSGATEIQLEAADDLTIGGSYFVFRLTLTPVAITATAGVPDYSCAAGKIVPNWVMRVADGLGFATFALPVRPGDTITTVRLNLTGQEGVSGHAAPPAVPPRFALLSVDIYGAVTTIAAANDPVNTVPAYNSSHSITLSGGLLPYVVTNDLLYVSVRCEGGAGSEVDMTSIQSIDGTGLARSFRGPSEFY